MAYIDKEKVKELIANYGKGAISDGLKTLDPVDDIVSIVSGVDLIPVVDVVEVVRCKDCGSYNKHYGECTLNGSHYGENGYCCRGTRTPKERGGEK